MKTTNDPILGAQDRAKYSARSILFWAGLLLVSGAPRIIGAFLLPNAFGDAYSYFEYIEGMRSKMASGAFAIKDLHGFWFPLYQFTCAIISLIFGHTFYVAKLVSALCGIGVCLLVYQISMRLTHHRLLSFLAFTAAALSPLHVLYSSTSMTDIPHAFLVMASLYFALNKRWKIAAAFAAAAGFMRIESWMLIVLLPAIQFLFERRVSLPALGIMLISPLFWLYICREATGSALAYFAIRNRYLAEYIAANPAVTTFSPQRLSLDARRLFVSTNFAVLFSCVAAVWITLRRMIAEKLDWRKFGSDGFAGVTAANVFFFSNLGFLVVAYFTGSQPDIWTRYGLIFFTLGIPVTAWTFSALRERRSKLIMATMVLAAFAYHTKDQVAETIHCVAEESMRARVGAYLKEAHRNDPSLRIYCDDGNVRFLSGVPRNKFLTASSLPSDRAALLKRFNETGVKYLALTNWEFSAVTKSFPELREGKGGDAFHPVTQVSSKYSGMEFWVYRFR